MMLQLYQSLFLFSIKKHCGVTKKEKCIMETQFETASAEYITIALLQLMKKKSFDRISITELCAKAGVSRMSFYRSFEGKTDILKKLAARISDDFIKRTGINYRNNPLKDFFVTLFTHLRDQQEIALLLERAGLLYIIKDEIDRVFLQSYRGVYDEYKACYLSGGIFNVFSLWLKKGCRETPAELAEKLHDILEK